MCCQTIITPVAYATFYLSSEQLTPVVLSAARSKGMSEVGQLLAKGWFGLCGVCGRGTRSWVFSSFLILEDVGSPGTAWAIVGKAWHSSLWRLSLSDDKKSSTRCAAHGVCLLRSSISLARGLDWSAQQGQPLPGPEVRVRAAALSCAGKLLPSKTAMQTTC